MRGSCGHFHRNYAVDVRNRPVCRAHSNQGVRGAEARDAPTAANCVLRGGLRESKAQSFRSDPWAAVRRAKARSYAAGPGFRGREPSRFLGTKRWKSQKLRQLSPERTSEWKGSGRVLGQLDPNHLLRSQHRPNNAYFRHSPTVRTRRTQRSSFRFRSASLVS